MDKSSLIRFLLTAIASLGLIFADIRYAAFDDVRQRLSLAVAPVRLAANLPGQIAEASRNYLRARATLTEERRELEEELLAVKARLSRTNSLAAENRRLRDLLGARESISEKAAVAEVVNTASLPFTDRAILNKGANHGLRAGQGVFDLAGVVGQITRVDADSSHVTLLTDSRMWVAARIVRSGQLALARGGGDGSGLLRLFYIPGNADIRLGDSLVTDGGGVFPAGLPVAEVTEVRRIPGDAFLSARAKPKARLAQHRALLIFTGEESPPESSPISRVTKND